ncbi:TetR/AcrR family transcriptional regulator [Diaminobutyricibacter sp. McL0608]|uniref:TetR/AcrR family transcriptional regulator n=1 Tax=Leifsonia sp. McL0608 TaxID=3143537 RepID=UPI0031F30A48
MTSSETPGLRERKRAETRQQLERAAVTLALEVGMENATVDAICESIPVSPRTFFNYFETKEDAILGVRDVELDEAALAAHLDEFRDADLTESIVGLIFTLIGPTVPDHELRQGRMELARKYPQLLGRQVAQLSRMGQQLVDAIAVIVGRYPRFAGDTDAERIAFAELILPFCAGAVKSAVKAFVAAGGTQTRDELQNLANTLIREALEKLK